MVVAGEAHPSWFGWLLALIAVAGLAALLGYYRGRRTPVPLPPENPAAVSEAPTPASPVKHEPGTASESGEMPADPYADGLPKGAIARMGSPRFNAGSAKLLAISPDGRFLATHRFGVVDVWTREGKRCSEVFLPGYHRTVAAFAFSPDGRLLLAGVDGHALIAWKIRNGELLRR